MTMLVYVTMPIAMDKHRRLWDKFKFEETRRCNDVPLTDKVRLGMNDDFLLIATIHVPNTQNKIDFKPSQYRKPYTMYNQSFDKHLSGFDLSDILK